ncbi:hypothetical protein SDC9_99125 [bioreactor metagenome]|uniref:Uncharacterized protein n=1 Tax=bioreactor metagenome TaxID=1076179 RepID=A0A645AHE8_9ZZZZ
MPGGVDIGEAAREFNRSRFYFFQNIAEATEQVALDGLFTNRFLGFNFQYPVYQCPEFQFFEYLFYGCFVQFFSFQAFDTGLYRNICPYRGQKF